MRTSKSFFIKTAIFIFLLFFSCVKLCAETASEQNFIVAAEKFSFTKGQTVDSVNDSLAEMIPVSILEKITKTLHRNVLPDERLSRQLYTSRSERQSLFLQLSSEYKKRDALVLENYSESILKSKIKEENKAIQAIQDKIDENLEEVKENQQKTELMMQELDPSYANEEETKATETELLKSFFTNIFTKNDSLITEEDIKLYQDDFTKLYVPSEKALSAGYTSTAFAKEVYDAKINLYLTGSITVYGNYVSVGVDAYLYPQAKKIGSAMEIGSIDDIDMVTTSLAGSILPFLTNALPVELEITILPEEAASNASFFIDDIVQKNIDKITLNSGTHTIQVVCDGYRTCSTTFGFSGNTDYRIEVNLQPEKNGYMQIGLIKPLDGELFTNGELSQQINNQKSQIIVNGKEILGEFVAENGEGAFFYIPKKMNYEENFVTINPKIYDREKNIDKRRKWMYGSYTLLMISLIPTFYTYGKLVNEAKLYNEGLVRYSEAIEVQRAANICEGISIGCGVFFGFELVRYLLAANSVLPQKARQGDKENYEYFDYEAALAAKKAAAETEAANELQTETADTENLNKSENQINTETNSEGALE